MLVEAPVKPLEVVGVYRPYGVARTAVALRYGTLEVNGGLVQRIVHSSPVSPSAVSYRTWSPVANSLKRI